MNRARSIDLPRTHVWLLPVAVPALALLFLLWTSVPAAAHFLNHHDRNDSEDSLDLRAIHLWEYPQEGLFSLVVRTYDQIEGRGRFIGWFDSFGDSHWDYALIIRVPSGCRMIARVGGPHTDIFASRVEPTRAHCLFQVHSGFKRTKHIRLRVWAKGDNGIVDRAPEIGWYAH